METATLNVNTGFKKHKSCRQLFYADKKCRIDKIKCTDKRYYEAHLSHRDEDAPHHAHNEWVHIYKSQNKHIKIPVLNSGEFVDV